MKKYGFAAAGVFCVLSCIAQTNDSFSDGDFTSSPIWSGTSNDFIVNPQFQLQLKSETAGTAYLSTEFNATSIDHYEWGFYIKQSFSPSGSNFSRVYLVSDQPAFTETLQGYYLQFGEAGSNDAIELFRQSGNQRASICRSSPGIIASAFAFRIKVTLLHGEWTLYGDQSGTQNYVQLANGTDTTFQSSVAMGVLCTYTISNSTKFYFDDFYVVNTAMSPPPPPEQPASLNLKDVVINEILPDVSPTIGLPDSEYIELYNRTKNSVVLSGWTLSDGTNAATIADASIDPSAYLLVVPSDRLLDFSFVGNVIGVSSFPSLNNSGDIIILRDAADHLIDSLNYNLSFYHDVSKSDGGWSLELIDPENICGQETNWGASEDDRGGTPGFANSIQGSNPDRSGPRLLEAIAASPDTLHLVFNETLDRSALQGIFNFVPACEVMRAEFEGPSLRTIGIIIGNSWDSETAYSVSVAGVTDCAGNFIEPEFATSAFSLPQVPVAGDLLINEVLFNPRPGGTDFVEIVNGSRKFIDLGRCFIGNVENAHIKNAVTLGRRMIVAPGSYTVLTGDSAALAAQYPKGLESRFRHVSMPSLPDDEGTVAIADSRMQLLDAMHYSSSYHSLLVEDSEGISLERISLADSADYPPNWTSATPACGFATPGYVNSNARPKSVVPRGEVWVDPEVFERENSFARISYSFDQPGFIANVKIVDQQGRLIKTIANNQLLGYEGFFRWDGDRDDGGPARIGYYSVWMEVFNFDGVVQTYRKRAAIFQR